MIVEIEFFVQIAQFSFASRLVLLVVETIRTQFTRVCVFTKINSFVVIFLDGLPVHFKVSEAPVFPLFLHFALARYDVSKVH